MFHVSWMTSFLNTNLYLTDRRAVSYPAHKSRMAPVTQCKGAPPFQCQHCKNFFFCSNSDSFHQASLTMAMPLFVFLSRVVLVIQYHKFSACSWLWPAKLISNLSGFGAKCKHRDEKVTWREEKNKVFYTMKDYSWKWDWVLSVVCLCLKVMNKRR